MAERDTPSNMPLRALVEQEPMAHGRVGPWRLAAAGIAAVLIVILVLYGVSRPTEPPQMTASSEQAASPASGGQQGQAQPSTAGAAPSGQGQQPKQAPAASQNRSDSATDKPPGDKAPAKK